MKSLAIAATAAAASMFVHYANAQAGDANSASPLGFTSYCDTNICPAGPYQNECPLCYTLDYYNNDYNQVIATCLQCYCFNSNEELQGGSTMRDSQNCASIGTDDNGNLVCNTSALRSGKHKSHKKSKKGSASDAVATAAPTVANQSGSGPVTFNFNCAAGTCPSGSYQNYCPRCTVDTNPDDGSTEPSIQCLCFNKEGVMDLGLSTMWNFDKCPEIDVSVGGKLSCPGASSSAGVTIYVTVEGKGN